MIDKVRVHLDEQEDDHIKDWEIIDALNTRQRMVVNDRMWTFNEGVRSASTVANRTEYPIDKDIKTVHSCRVNGQPIEYKSRTEWEEINYLTDSSAEIPWILSIFVNSFRFDIYQTPVSYTHLTLPTIYSV